MAQTITVLLRNQFEEKPVGTDAALSAPFNKMTDLELDVRRISDEISKLLVAVEDIKHPSKSDLQISEIEFHLGVNAKGKVGIVCASGEVAVHTLIKVIIRRHT
jgi:hypothetical protein